MTANVCEEVTRQIDNKTLVKIGGQTAWGDDVCIYLYKYYCKRQLDRKNISNK